jgi:hypothetical protein
MHCFGIDLTGLSEQQPALRAAAGRLNIYFYGHAIHFCELHPSLAIAAASLCLMLKSRRPLSNLLRLIFCLCFSAEDHELIRIRWN